MNPGLPGDSTRYVTFIRTINKIRNKTPTFLWHGAYQRQKSRRPIIPFAERVTWLPIFNRSIFPKITPGSAESTKDLEARTLVDCCGSRPILFTGQMPFLSPNRECQGTGEIRDRKVKKEIWVSKLLLHDSLHWKGKKGKASSLDIAPLTILNSGTLQPRKWQLTGNDCGTAAHAVAAQSLR